MKIVNAKNFLVISLVSLFFYSIAHLFEVIPFNNISFLEDKSIVFLNLLILIFTFFLIRLIDVTTHNRNLDTNKNKVLIEFLKSLLVFIAIMIVMQNMGYNFNTLLAIGGAGSLIVGFAAKDSMSNIFGYITILLDRPFDIGDLISCEQHKISGTVKKIGLRTTELTRVDKKPIYVPNGVWTTASIVNSSRKTNREIDITVPLLCCEPDKLQSVIQDARKAILSYPDIDPKHSINIFIDKLDNYGAHIRVILYLNNISISDFYKLKEEIYLNLMKIVNDQGATVNFLTSV